MKSTPRYRRLTAGVLCASLIMPATSHAVTPDNHAPISAFWTAANILKEWFDWRSAVGWGSIGLTNVILTAATGESGGSMTKAAFQFVCGTTASGIMSTIKVPTAPTATNHIATIVKGASVVGPSVLCGWVSKWVYDVVLPPIDASITLKNINLRNYPYTIQQIGKYGTEVNIQMLNMERNYKNAAVAKSNADYWAGLQRKGNCYLAKAGRTPLCKAYLANYQAQMGIAQTAIDALNANAKAMKTAQNGLNAIYFG